HQRPHLRLPLRHGQGARGEGFLAPRRRRRQIDAAAGLLPGRHALPWLSRGAHRRRQVRVGVAPVEPGAQAAVIVVKERVEGRLAVYGVARAETLTDPLMWGRVQEARRLLASRMNAVSREELRSRVPAGDLHVSRKVDGEFTMLVVDGDEAFTVNPGG